MIDRQSAIELTGLTRSQLQLLINDGVIKPCKIGDGLTAKSFYSFSEIAKMYLVKQLKQQSKEKKAGVTYERIKEVVKALEMESLQGEGIVLCVGRRRFELISVEDGLRSIDRLTSFYQLFIFIDEVVTEIEDLAKKKRISNLKTDTIGFNKGEES